LAVLSADGRSVAFLSEAGNLVTNDTNGVEDVFVRDLRRGVTERVSVATGGAEGNQVGSPFEAPAISGDGRLVAFTSGATNLVAGDDNIFFDDIFVHDRRTGRTEAVSVTADGRTGDRGGSHPAISADGRYVAFDSASSNLVPGDTNGVSDVFVRDLWAGTTRRVSVTRDGRQADADSFRPSLSARGGRVTFTSSAGLVAADTNGALDVYVRNLSSTRTTRQVSVAWDGGQPDSDSFGPPVISLDGRHVAFSSQARNLVPDDIDVPKLFIRDSGMGATPESWSAPG
jgi:Tol biopolymer transport system component